MPDSGIILRRKMVVVVVVVRRSSMKRKSMRAMEMERKGGEVEAEELDGSDSWHRQDWLRS